MRIYVACPISKGDPVRNIKNNVDVADQLAAKGHIVYVPALSFFYRLFHPERDSYDFWLKQDFGWIEVCDALLRMPGESWGADQEVSLAYKLGIPVYYSVDEVPDAERDIREGSAVCDPSCSGNPPCQGKKLHP